MKPAPKELSPARRLARVFVWVAFALVLFLRFVVVQQHPPRSQPAALWQPQGPGPRFRRPPTPVRPAVANVPADLPRIEIQVAPQDVETLRSYFWNGWRGQRVQQRPEVLVTVREGSTVYTNVALHQKGAAGSFRPLDDKPALTLNFAKNAKGQRFHGYSKISLNNSVQDPTYLCEAICRELFDAAGVPVPKADFATVLLNGRDLGLYVMIEGYNKDFLRRYFKNVKGNLYDGGFCQEIGPGLTVNSGDFPEDRSDLERLMAAARESVPETRWARLQQILDTDRFITMLAMEVLTCHWDGYGLNRNNYRVFHNLETDRMIFMPHGMDQMFDYPPGRYPAEGSIQPNMRGTVARAVMTTPEGARRYFERLQALHSNLFKPDFVVGRVHALADRIRPTLSAYELTRWHDAAVESLCERITRRISSVGEQLNRPREPVSFNQSGVVQISRWTDRFISQGAALELDIVEQAGKNLLHLSASERGGTGSWRTRVLLPNGNYRFEGRARGDGLTANQVCLRISGAPRVTGQPLRGTDWVPLNFEFALDALVSEVVLVCEFTGARGEAWFDVDSLRLVRQ